MEPSDAAPIGNVAHHADKLILLPILDSVLMPGTVLSVIIDRPVAAAALQEAARTEQHLAVFLQRGAAAEPLTLNELHEVGPEAPTPALLHRP